MDTILQSPEGASLGGEKRVITTLMSDLKGFTPIAERLSAESVVGIINQIDVIPKGFKKSITIYEIGGIYGDYNLFLPKKT